MTKQIVQVTVRNVYGKETVYPANSLAEKLANLSGKKTFTHRDLGLIESMGFVIFEVHPNHLAKAS
jgi:hypothetical protein